MSDAFDVLETAELFLIDFYLPGCPPCRKLAPVLAEFSAEAHIPVVKVDLTIKRWDKLSDRYHVIETPTVVAIRNREEIARGIPETKKDLYKLCGLEPA